MNRYRLVIFLTAFAVLISVSCKYTIQAAWVVGNVKVEDKKNILEDFEQMTAGDVADPDTANDADKKFLSPTKIESDGWQVNQGTTGTDSDAIRYTVTVIKRKDGKGNALEYDWDNRNDFYMNGSAWFHKPILLTGTEAFNFEVCSEKKTELRMAIYVKTEDFDAVAMEASTGFVGGGNEWMPVSIRFKNFKVPEWWMKQNGDPGFSTLTEEHELRVIGFAPNWASTGKIAFDNISIGKYVKPADKLVPDYPYWGEYRQNPEPEPQAWRKKDDIIDGWDWSLPPKTPASPYARFRLGHEDFNGEFPGYPINELEITWRELEPEEGKYRFDLIKKNIDEFAEKNQKTVLRIYSSVWDKTLVRDPDNSPAWFEKNKSAPRWLEKYNIPIIKERPGGGGENAFQIYNMDILHPEFHERYKKFVVALGRSGIPEMEALVGAYIGFKSPSQGEEGAGEPPDGDPERVNKSKERLKAWADAFGKYSYKLASTAGGNNPPHAFYQNYAFSLGMGIRQGFVEMYLYHIPSEPLGQKVDENGYLWTDEDAFPIKNKAFFGDENEEYQTAWTHRFGKVESYPYRYFTATLRTVQMQRTYLLHSAFFLNPELTYWQTRVMGLEPERSPDAWCWLRESYLKPYEQLDYKGGAVKNFEHRIFQRDTAGYETVPVKKINQAIEMWMVEEGKYYDYVARKGKKIGFAVSDRFMTGKNNVAIKITYHDDGTHQFVLKLKDGGSEKELPVQLTGTGKLKTATFFVVKATFDAKNYDYDFTIEGKGGDAVISLVRVIRNG